MNRFAKLLAMLQGGGGIESLSEPGDAERMNWAEMPVAGEPGETQRLYKADTDPAVWPEVVKRAPMMGTGQDRVIVGEPEILNRVPTEVDVQVGEPEILRRDMGDFSKLSRLLKR